MEERELHELVDLVNAAIAGFDTDFEENLQGNEGYLAFSDYFNQLE